MKHSGTIRACPVVSFALLPGRMVECDGLALLLHSRTHLKNSYCLSEVEGHSSSDTPSTSSGNKAVGCHLEFVILASLFRHHAE